MCACCRVCSNTQELEWLHQFHKALLNARCHNAYGKLGILYSVTRGSYILTGSYTLGAINSKSSGSSPVGSGGSLQKIIHIDSYCFRHLSQQKERREVCIGLWYCCHVSLFSLLRNSPQEVHKVRLFWQQISCLLTNVFPDNSTDAPEEPLFVISTHKPVSYDSCALVLP